MRAPFLLLAAFSAAAAACVLEQSPDQADKAESPVEASVSACMAGARPSLGLSLAPALSDKQFSQPIGMYPSPTSNDAYYVVERKGNVKRVTSAGVVSTVLELGARVNASAGEAGLLGFAFHPKFAENGQVFLSFTKPWQGAPASQRSIIARGTSMDGGLTVKPETLVEVLSLPDDPYWNHNGGHIAFGHDGFLYASFGDGGSGGDPLKNGQNKNSLFGKIIRIDVDGTTNETPNYAIPNDNPFRNGGGRPEIFSYGMRNTWRFSFDRANGDLWAGDVGQNKYEEIDKVVLGGNYGWGTREGKHCYGTTPNCEIPGAIDPVVEYDRSQGSSVTGGFVYRGTQIPGLQGWYIYGDYGSGKVWAFPVNQPNPTPRLVMNSGTNISSFAEDNQGELYMLDYGAGKVRKIVATIAAGSIPEKLSQTGCFNEADPRQPTTRLIPYDVNSPLYSDGAEKHRWLALPQGAKIKVLPDGDFDMPVGSVLVKEFRVGDKRVETRLFVRHTDGGWAGYTYEWNETESEATLLPDGKTKPLPGGQTWNYPSRGQCMQCHNGAAGGSLGLETAQLDREFAYPDGAMNQLAKLTALGAFDPTAPLPASHQGLPSPANTAESAEARARSYLHSNCGFCHRPAGPGRGIADLRFDRTFAQTKVCNGLPESGDYGTPGAKLLTPGQPAKSIISLRMHASGEGAMPPIGRSVVDPLGTAVVDGWITSVTACP